MKKKYIKPSMEVYKVECPTRILAGSNNDYPGQFGYIPGQPVNDKNLA